MFLPTLVQNGRKSMKKGAKKIPAPPKNKGKSKPLKKVPSVEDDEIIIPGDSSEEIEEVPATVKQSVQLVEPFSDGIVSACLNNITIIPRVGNQETDVLRGFLKHFSVSGTFIGNVSSRLSFMKKKGGLLL